MAPKKAAKKSASKKASSPKAVKPTATGNVRGINYKCNTGGVVTTPHFANMSPGDVVVMMALKGDIEISFVGLSPFYSGATIINITKGNYQTEVVKTMVADPNNPTSFPYTVVQTDGGGGSAAGNPEMIVP